MEVTIGSFIHDNDLDTLENYFMEYSSFDIFIVFFSLN